MGSFLFGCTRAIFVGFVGFLIMFFLLLMFPSYCPLIGGFIGGLVAGIMSEGTNRNGTFAGLWAGIFYMITIAILAVMALAFKGVFEGGILDGLFGDFEGLNIVIIAVGYVGFGAFASSVGGSVGGFVCGRIVRLISR